MIDNIHVNQTKPYQQHPYLTPISKMIQLLYIKYNIILAFNLKESPMKPRGVIYEIVVLDKYATSH
jgi:hypothetical protein